MRVLLRMQTFASMSAASESIYGIISPSLLSADFGFLARDAQIMVEAGTSSVSSHNRAIYRISRVA